MRFLIDDCLSIDLIPIASEAGHDAQHVARAGKAGWKSAPRQTAASCWSPTTPAIFGSSMRRPHCMQA
jgi:hypothetical protein